MVEELSCDESRITIFERPLICRFCQQDVFIPYSTYRDVEEPGIQVFFVNYTAICMHCGCVIQFGDPSDFDHETGRFIWAFDQTLLNPPEPKPPVFRVVDEKKLQAKKRCLYLALQLLIKKEKVADTVLTLAEREEYFGIKTLLEKKTAQLDDEVNAAEQCLVTALIQLISYGLINRDKFFSILENDSYYGVELFLKEYLNQ